MAPTWLKKFVAIQLCLSLGVACSFWIRADVEAGLSALIGGSIAILAGFAFFRLFFNTRATQPAKQILARFYLGEVLKLMMVTLLFTLAFQWSRLRPVPLLLAFAATYAGYWLLPWITRKEGLTMIKKIGK